MALVDYSGSENSDQEEEVLGPLEDAKSKTNKNKATFQNVVDRSNPHKIRVSLPVPTKIPNDGGRQIEEPPAKRAKLGSGGGFNSFLPAPKRTTALNGGSGINGARRGGLGSGINLKTGASPGFSREPVPSADMTPKDDDESFAQDTVADNGKQGPATDQNIFAAEDKSLSTVDEEPKRKSIMFKPLSVTRKPTKKKTPQARFDTADSQWGDPEKHSSLAPKLSLFSTGGTAEVPAQESATNGTYQPMVYQAREPVQLNPAMEYGSSQTYNAEDHHAAEVASLTDYNPQAQSLDAIASDLNLSTSAKRQLLGRQKNNASTNIKVLNFNTDEEYKANELFRQAGEQVQHNPVRAIAPGKHSLKQLVNAASTQKDALEESFATGRRNKAEAGSKYGW